MFKKIIETIRGWLFIVITLIAMALCAIRLMKLQIVMGEDYLNQSKTSSYGNQVISAARGEIVDSSGNLIVKNKVGFNIVLEKAFFPSDNDEQNRIIHKVITLLRRDGENWTDNLPISSESPFVFLPSQETAVSKMLKNLNLQNYATAEDCIMEMIDKYGISLDYNVEEARLIAGIRYEMEQKGFSVSNRYTLAEDVLMDTVIKIKELTYDLPGVDVVEDAVRTYEVGDVLPHAIGTVGAIDAEEYAELKDKGYGLNSVLGKSGIEKAMEQYLRGTDGTRQLEMMDGKVISDTITEEAIPGNTVQLTVDSDFQRQMQAILERHILYLRNQTEADAKGKTANAGALVVVDVKTGAVLGMATYPTYDINDYITNYESVVSRENSPLTNRAINGLYRPGSTFKTITACAGLNEGIIDASSTVFCGHKYTYYPDWNPPPGCLGWHGNINVVTALEKSCNIFFYDVGRRVGIDTLARYAAMFGLGEETGLEIGGAKGYVASPAVFDKYGWEWNTGNVIQAAIGQSETNITPIQMACQAMTIANKGVRYQPYLVDSIHTYNMEETVKKTEPKIAAVVPDNTGTTFDVITQGMIKAAATVKAHNSKVPFDVSLTTLPFEVAIKTGSPQKTADISSSAVIGFAPADDPEIAFACYVEEGEYAKYMVRSIIDVYFGTGDGTPISADEIVTTAPTETTAPPEQTLSDTVTATETSAPETAAETTVPETSAAETSE